VTSSTGSVVHVTRKMAAMLGRTVPQILANGSPHAVEQLIMEPFAQLHRLLAQTLPASAPPPYGCRSGLSVLLNELGSQGRNNAVPFRMAMKRQQHGDEILHVSCLEKRSLSQVIHALMVACVHEPAPIS
jgi:hypothetical protein